MESDVEKLVKLVKDSRKRVKVEPEEEVPTEVETEEDTDSEEEAPKETIRHYVYRIINTLDDKHYYGVSTAPWKRISAHLTGDGSKLIASDIDKIGRHVFLAQLIDSFDTEEEAERTMRTLVVRHAAIHPTGYNQAIGGKGSKGHFWSMEQRAKINGERNSQSKLTEADVIAIYFDTRSRTKIATEFGISKTMVTKIKKGQAWKHVTLAFRDE